MSIYQFQKNGSYELVLASRQKGSTNQTIVARETGTFAVQGDLLQITPKSGTPRIVRWRIERDRYIGNVQLVMMRPNGTLDIYSPR